MKKIIPGIFILLFLLLLSVYLFIPAQLTVSKIVIAQANKSGVLRVLADESKWPQWWPDDKRTTQERNDIFYYNNFYYQFNKAFLNTIKVSIENRQSQNSSSISVIPLNMDSVALEWKCVLHTGFNPIQKITAYIKARNIKRNMADILNHLASFVGDVKNIYGFSVRYTTLKDTVLVATKTVTQNYPSTKVIYSLVNKLKEYIASEGAKEVNYPMLNVYTKDSVTYQTMVGIPTNRELEGSGDIFNRHLVPMKNKILTTDVQGGPAAVAKGYNAIINYMNDHQLSAPVIPFAYLVTDRSKEPDTTKWMTRIYYPII